MMLVNRIHRITYPIYRGITLVARLFAFFITLPIRIITFVTTQTQVLLKNLLILLIIISIIIGLIVLFSDEQQSNYMKSYIQNKTNVLLKYSSMV
jgi:steroid 5-alpha reductase family enzyme